MDPFSIISGSVGLLDVCWRVGSYLNDVKEAARNIEADLQGLQDEIDALRRINTVIEDLQKKTTEAGLISHLDQAPELKRIWKNIDENTRGCTAVLVKLEEEVKRIMGKNQQAKPKSKIDGIRKAVRRQSNDPQLLKFHQSLSKYHQSSQVCLTALEIFYTRHAYKATEGLSGKADKLLEKESQLEYQIKVLRSQHRASDSVGLLETIEAAAAVINKPLNKHFMPPRSVSSIFTGREDLLEELGKTLDDDYSLESDGVQKRFVIQGLGGSGKTEFCCRFAQVNRQKFWGVFSINATSQENAKEGFALIAKIGGVEPNERAAKAWLASLEFPWLLIIDNADDPYLDISNLFPAGERGFILITTRVPENTKHGTVGRKSFVFEQLESRAATTLLLKAAQLESPWDTKTMDGAGSISKALGYLPLALIHAGSAIANRLCELGGYLEYFERLWDDIDQAKRQRRARRPKHPDSDDSEDDEPYMGVYSSYEILYRRLEKGGREETTSRSRDAIDLLRIFSFFNRENIRLDLLIAAAKNAVPKPVGQDEKQKPWTQRLRELTLKELIYALRIELFKDRSQPVFPQMLRDVLDESITIPAFESRLRSGMKVLTQYSLVTYQEATRSYAMHPLVHVWVRKRPQMSLGEKAIWAQAAKNTITYSITIPLEGTPSKEELEFHRSLLLHIMNLRKRQSEIAAKIRRNQTRLHRIFPYRIFPVVIFPVAAPKSDLEVADRDQALQCGKLSYVYTICGKWDEALDLQQAVKDFLVPNLGWEHEASIRICKYLSRTYLLKGRFNEAGTLNEQALHAAINALGEEHQLTLEIMDSLGYIRTLQGRLPEAEEMHSRAIKGMRKTHGSDHPDTLSAIDNLGSVFWHKFEFERAVECHLEALKGMLTKLGPTHERTLAAKENVAVAYREIGGAYLDEAHELMEEVLEERTKLLGREQPWTLIAMSNLAYVKHTMGEHEEAERIIRKGLPIAARNLGEDHHGVLAAKLRLALILTAQERYDEAKALFEFLLDRDKYAGVERTEGNIKGYHASWIYAFYQYVLFWEHQGKVKEALDACEELCKVLESSKHRIRDMAYDKREDLTRRFAFPLL